MYLITSHKRNYLLLASIIGGALGLLSIFSPGSVFVAFAILVIILALKFFSADEDRKFLTRLFIWGITLRLILAALLQFLLILKERWLYLYGDRTILLFGDDGYYTLRSWNMAKYFLGKVLSRDAFLDAFHSYGRGVHLYIFSLFQYLFGFSPVSLIFINCLLSVLTGIIYYFIAKKIMGIRVARLSSLLIVFFPSLIFWSILNLKDPTLIFLGAVIFWLFLRLIETKKVRKSLILSVLLSSVLYLQYYTRRSIFLTTFLAILVSFSIITYSTLHVLVQSLLRINTESKENAIKCIKKRTGYIVLLVILILICLSIFYLKEILVVSHQGFVASGGFIYRIYADHVYKMCPELVSYVDIIGALPKGILHFLFEPFPWKIHSVAMLIVYPQLIVWYLLLPFSVFGVLNKFKILWKEKVLFVSFILFTVSIFSLGGGNIGTNFRVRDGLTPVMLMFAAKGILDIADGLSQRKRL